MYNVKIQLVCIFLSFAGIVYSQNTTTSTKISEEEKTRIKQNFKNDSRFYINDDGVVVYTRNESKSDSIKTAPLTPLKVQVSEQAAVRENNLINGSVLSDSGRVASKDAVKTVDDAKIDPLFSNDNDAIAENATSAETVTPLQFFTKSKDDVHVDPVAVEKTVQQQSSISTEPEVQVAYGVKKKSEKVNISEEDKEIISQPQTGSAYIVKEERESVSKAALEQAIIEQEAEVLEDVMDVTPLSKKKATYNSLEEANLAVDQLLVQLKREQKQINKPESKSNSLSSRVVNGYRPDPTRKNEARKEASDYDLDDSENVNGDFGTEPTYYINGVVVDKAEVLKLRNRNILSRTIKVRNTASKNPNGEIWIEVRNFQ